MANRYNDQDYEQDYPRYNERNDRYDSRSEFGSERNRNAGGRGFNSEDRDDENFQNNARSPRTYTGGFGRNTREDHEDYTLYGYDRDVRYSSGSEEERGNYGRGGDYGYGSRSGSSGSNFDRMSASDYRRNDRNQGRNNDRSNQSNQFGRESSYGQSGGYTGNYNDSNRGYETENRGGSNRDDRGWLDKTTDEISSWFGDDEAARRRQMDARQGGGQQISHRGKGPKNYRRSDDRIRDDINDRLTDYPYLDASDIDVEVNNGEVVLTGTVESRYAKRMTEDIVDNISGVTHVENRLRVKQNTPTSSSSGTSSLSPLSETNATTGMSSGSTTDSTFNSSTGTTSSTETAGESGDANASTTGRSRTESA